MKLMDIIKNTFGGKEPKEDIDDNITTDRYLRSLRRQKRMQNEELEKESLKKEIAEFEKSKVRRNIYGLKEEHKVNLVPKKANKEWKLLNQKKMFLK